MILGSKDVYIDKDKEGRWLTIHNGNGSYLLSIKITKKQYKRLKECGIPSWGEVCRIKAL